QRAFASLNRLLERLDEDDPGSDPMRRTLLIEARGFLGGLLDDPGHANDPAVRREIASAHRHLAHLNDILGEPEQAEFEYRRAVSGLEGLIRESPERTIDRRNLALT